MKKSKLINLFIMFFCLSIFSIQFAMSNTTSISNQPIKTVTFATETADAWTPTFQLCWNELIKLIGTPKVEYLQSNPKLADELNKQKFNKNDINEDSYYISVTKMTQKHKKEIEKAIWDKFKEKSDILGKFNFENVSDDKTSKWFIYSILLKNFKFATPYNILKSDYFNNIKTTKYKYFGFIPGEINQKAKETLENGFTETIFYENDNSFALKLIDKDKKDEMILYLTNSHDSMEKIYNEMLKKAENKNKYTEARKNLIYSKNGKNVRIKYNRFYKIPFIKIDENFNFDKELANKPIKDKTYNITGDTWTILKTIQTIKFDMNNEGAKLKSEAAIAIMKNSAAFVHENTINMDDYYYFNRPFVIYLKEVGKEKPYFAAKIKDGKYLIKE